MQTLEKDLDEKMVDYYNSLIEKGDVTCSKKTVTLEWLKRQQIVEGRDLLNIEFGYVVVDDILGKKSSLAEAEDMLSRLSSDNSSLPNIACLLAAECKEILEEGNPVREKYSSLDSKISITTFEFPAESSTCFSLFPNEQQISIEHLKEIVNLINEEKYCNRCCYDFLEYLQKAAIRVLETAFEEIKKEVEAKTR